MIIEEISRLVGEKKLEQRRRGKDRGSDELQREKVLFVKEQ